MVCVCVCGIGKGQEKNRAEETRCDVRRKEETQGEESRTSHAVNISSKDQIILSSIKHKKHCQ